MGYRKARPKQETESLEMIRLDQELADGANPDDVAFLKELFTPKDLPINAYSTYVLDNFSNYYDDIKPETKDEGCKDSQWVEPKFARLYESIDTSLEFGNNPNSTTDEILPAIAYGKNQRERKYIQIIIPESRTAKIRKPERFKETTYTQNQEGEGLSQGLNIGSANINDGRPSVQPRVEPADKVTAIARAKGKEDLASFNFWFSCGTTINTSAPEKESISFTYVDDENQAREVAALRLAKENTQNAFTCSINVRYRSYYQEGDIIQWDGRTWRILGVSDNQEITNGPIVDSVYLTLSLGQDLRPTVRMIRVASEDYEPSQIGQGSTGASSFQTRFNFASG
jgi:hypothetical protein